MNQREGIWQKTCPNQHQADLNTELDLKPHLKSSREPYAEGIKSDTIIKSIACVADYDSPLY